MNLFGKILIMLNLLMSLVFMGFAVAVYSTHKNWKDVVMTDKATVEIPSAVSGKVVALGTPQELKSAIGQENATMDDVFIHHAGTGLETGGGTYRDASRARRVANRVR